LKDAEEEGALRPGCHSLIGINARISAKQRCFFMPLHRNARHGFLRRRVRDDFVARF